MIGISFPFDRYDEFAELLPRMAESGVRRIELQELNHSHLPNDVFRVTACLRKLGMDVIYHTAEASPQNALKPLATVLSNMEKGRILLITAPPLSSISAVRGLAEYVRENHLPITVASVCDERTNEGDLADFLSAADAFDTDVLSLCLDIRHMDAECGLAMLSNKHLRSRISHIRATEIGEEMDNSRKNLLTEAGFGYFESFNISLSFAGELNANMLSNAISALNNALPHTVRLYDDIRDHFDQRFRKALTIWNESGDGTHFSLIQSTAFLFCTNGFRWAMDVAFRNAYRLANLPQKAAELLGNMQLMIISHSHSDHFEERTIRRLAGNNMVWIIPDFLIDTALAWGIPFEKIISAHAGEQIQVGPLTVLPFEGRHFRPVTGKGVKAYGYHISAERAPSMVFPGDTRDFSLEGLPVLPPAEYCFANVWLGDHNGFAKQYDLLAPYVRYMLHFSKKNILLTHLYECNRRGEDMWRREHAQLIADEIRQVSPDTGTYIPCAGEVIRFE